MKYKFEIGAYSPETIPMSRLAEYMADLAKLLGEKDSVHFDHLERGSTIPVISVDYEAIPKVRARINTVNTDRAPADVESAYKALDKKLAEDNTSGRLYAIVLPNEPPSNILAFPGAKRVIPVEYGQVKEPTSIDGVIVSLGGTDDTAHIKLQAMDGIYTGIEVSRDIAKKLAPHMWASTVRLHGEGRWERDEGIWNLRRLRVSHYQVLEDVSLVETINELRKIDGSGWKLMDDPVAIQSLLREEAKKH